MKKFSIHTRLLVSAVLLICATTFSLGYMGIQITHDMVQTRFKDRMQLLARYLAENSELGIIIDQRSQLNELASNLLTEKDVIRVRIMNLNDEALADQSHPGRGKLETVEALVIIKGARANSESFLLGSDSMEHVKRIGRVEITYSTYEINRLLHAMKMRFIWIAVVLAAVGIVIFYFISRSLVAPVMHLAVSARQVADGDRDIRARPGKLPETRELALAFNAMLDSLDQSQKALFAANQEMFRQKTLAKIGKFSMMIAHEVKNPLGIVKSSLDMLKKDLNVSSDNTLVSYMEDEIQRLNGLIEDFLQFSRPVKPTLRRVDLNEMLQDVISRFEIQYAETGLRIHTGIPTEPQMIETDRDLLVRALANIIKNACEADPEEGVVDIAAGGEEDFWTVTIRDRGDGIPDENLQKIFEPFFTTRAKGTGLGLAFAMQVVQTQGGVLFAENHAEGGAVFTVKIPLTENAWPIYGDRSSGLIDRRSGLRGRRKTDMTMQRRKDDPHTRC